MSAWNGHWARLTILAALLGLVGAPSDCAGDASIVEDVLRQRR